MKTKFVIISLISLVVLLTSCSKNKVEILPSSFVSTDEIQLNEIHKLSVSHMFNAFIIFSDTEEKILVEANDNLQRHIQIKTINGKLKISLDNDINIIDRNLVLNVYVTIKDLQEINLEGGVHAELLDDLIRNELELNISGASKFKGAVFANDISASIIGASAMDLSGSAELLDIYASGASVFRGYDFESNQLKSELTGACKVYATVRNHLNIKAEGASIVYYKGEGEIKSQNLKGASQIIKMD